jgi:hypothetical protein
MMLAFEIIAINLKNPVTLEFQPIFSESNFAPAKFSDAFDTFFQTRSK